jgi:RNA polymerase sigma-70 factor (ECF subfamily)
LHTTNLIKVLSEELTMHNTIPDEELIQACIEGKRYAQKVLYDRYYSLMYAICVRYTGNKEEAEDVLIEGFIKIFSKIKEFRNEGSFEGWLKRIIINTAINNFRYNSKKKYLNVIDNEKTVEVKDDIDIFKKNYSAEYLIKLIQQLPDGYRIIFNMYEIEGYSHKEIANELGITVSTSKTQLFHAKRILKNKILNEFKLDLY